MGVILLYIRVSPNPVPRVLPYKKRKIWRHRHGGNRAIHRWRQNQRDAATNQGMPKTAGSPDEKLRRGKGGFFLQAFRGACPC